MPSCHTVFPRGRATDLYNVNTLHFGYSPNFHIFTLRIWLISERFNVFHEHLRTAK